MSLELENFIKQVNEPKYNYMLKLINIYNEIYSKITKCPKCDGHYFMVDLDDCDYSFYWQCNKEFDFHSPTKKRINLLNEFCKYDYNFWDSRLNDEMMWFTTRWNEEEQIFNYIRDFSIDAYNKQIEENNKRFNYIFKEKTWEELVESELDENIKQLSELIIKAYNVPMLKRLFAKLLNNNILRIEMKTEPEFKFYLMLDENVIGELYYEKW